MRIESKSAFTLIEVLLSVSIFVVFMGLAFSAYLHFQSLSKEAFIARTVMLETESSFAYIRKLLKENVVDYEAYVGESLSGSVLYLKSPSGGESRKIFLDEDSGLIMEERGDVPAQALHSIQVRADELRFSVFPLINPYETVNVLETSMQFQPFVQIDLSMSMPGRIMDRVDFDLHGSVTSRFYR